MKDVMAALSGQENWHPTASVWVPTQKLLLLVQAGADVATADRREEALSTSLQQALSVAGPIAQALGETARPEASEEPAGTA
jgi:hypothetical protein